MKRGSKPQLSERSQRFVDEYVVDLNATRAAIRAGYSAASAYSQGHRLLKNAEVAAAIAAAKRARAKRLAISADRVLQELARLAYFDIRRTVDENGAPIPLHLLDGDTAAAIAGVEVVEQFEMVDGERVPTGLLKKYRVFDKNTAVGNMMKHLGLLKDTLSLNLPPGGALVRVEFVDPPNGVPAATPEGETNG